MRTIRLDAETANRLVSGQMSPDDAPPGYAGVAQLLAQAKTAPGASSAKELATVAAIGEAVRGHLQLPTPSTREKKMLAKVLTVKGAVVAVAVLFGAGTAAAATGSLPSQAQNAVHNALAHLDVSVPDGNANQNGTDHGQSSNHSGTQNSHAKPGLCNAAAHNGTTTPNAQGTKPNSHSVFGSFNSSTCTGVGAPGNSANGGPDATPGSGGSNTTGQGQDGQPASVPPGPPTSVSTPAPVPTPNQGSGANQSGSGNSGSGLNTANTNDGGASSTGSGAASSGSGNATSGP